MQNLSRAFVGLSQRASGGRVDSIWSRWWPAAVARRCPSVGRVRCAPTRLWPPAFARLDAPLMDSASAHFNRRLHRLSRFVCSPCCNKEKQNWPHSCIFVACASTKCIDISKMRKEVTGVKKVHNEKKLTNEVTKNNSTMAAVDVWFPHIIPNSSHRDGAIYKNERFKKGDWFDFNICDRNETQLEPMLFTKPAEGLYFPIHMLQCFSLTLAECSISNDPIQLYGYIATRDDRDCMLNYVINYSRDDPITAQKGSLIQMTGPKRGIEMVAPVLVEFDMRIKIGGREEDDPQLIDGAIECDYRSSDRPVKHRIEGNCGTVDISLGCLEAAVEATIEVVISEVHSGFSLSLSSFVYVEDYEEIQLFHGIVDQSCGLRRFVLAVTWCDVMILKFKLGNNNVERCSFKADLFGCASRQIKHELANILVTVSWSTI